MSAIETNVPDLLRRFAPAERCTRAVLEGFDVTLETGDPNIIAAVREEHLNHINGASVTAVSLKLIRDDDAPSDGGQLTLITSWPLATLLLGTGTVLALDCERREILGFVAGCVPAERVIREMLSKLFDILRSGGPSTPSCPTRLTL